MPHLPKYKNLVKTVHRMQKEVELKYVDYAFQGEAIDAIPDPRDSTFTNQHNLLDINFGTGQGQRVGRDINPTSLKLNITLYAPNTGTLDDSYNQIRLIIFKYKPGSFNSGSATPVYDIPDLGEVLAVPRNGGTIITTSPQLSLHAMYNMNTRSDYKVLYDKLYYVTALENSTDDSGRHLVHIKLNIPLGWESTYFENSTFTASNGLYMYLYSDSTQVPHPTVWGNARTYFKDA